MNKGYYARVAEWLVSLVIVAPDVCVPADPRYIRLALGRLMDLGWTKDEIKRKALAEADVIIRDDLFPEEERRWKN